MRTLLDLFALFAARKEKTAIIHRTGFRRFEYSYHQLSDYSLRMAHWLELQGIKKGDRILLWAPNGPWWAVAFWGSLLRGAVVVPVDFSSGKERAEKITDISESTLVIQSQYRIDKLQNKKNVFIEDLEYMVLSTSPIRERVPVAPEDLAELVFTSGTTGDPKGVMLTHKNIIANLLQVNQQISLKPEYCFLSLLPLSHMFEQMAGFLSPLYRGATIIYIRTLKPAAILQALEKENVSVVTLVPRLLQVLKTSIERQLDAKHLRGVFNALRSFSEFFPRSVRKKIFFPIQHKFGRYFAFFVSGGATLETELARFWTSLGFAVIEGYGITECSPVLSVNTEKRQIAGSVGTPLPDTQIKIENGEILVKGNNVFVGYYKNENATREVFTDDGWFKTGDLGFIDGSHNLYIKGRRKEVIITAAGINVYPDDIEPVLNRIRGIREACVVGFRDSEGGEEVHAVLILDGSGRPPEQIIKEANTKLDPLQQIMGFTLWPNAEFPKTNTLKVQKFIVKQRLETHTEGKETTLSDKLIMLVSQVTGKSADGIHEKSVLVSDLGLSSLARLELVNYLEQEFRMDIDDTAITQYTTVADVRDFIHKRRTPSFKSRLRLWTNTPFIRGMRRLVDLVLIKRFFGFLVKLEVYGIEHLKDLNGPVFYASNHISYFDAAAIYYALPKGKRYKVGVAAGDDFFFGEKKGFFKKILRRGMYEFSSIFFNTFILPEMAGFKRAVEHMGSLTDLGVSILYFPEGGLMRNGKPLPFQQGVGIMVRELKIPVIPIKLEGLEEVVAPDTGVLHRGTAKVKFGKPLHFENEQPSEIVRTIRESVYSL